MRDNIAHTMIGPRPGTCEDQKFCLDGVKFWARQ
jgi:hypothetical protein